MTDDTCIDSFVSTPTEGRIYSCIGVGMAVLSLSKAMREACHRDKTNTIPHLFYVQTFQRDCGAQHFYAMRKNLRWINCLVAVLICVAMSLAFTSCKDDDDDEPSQNDFKENLIGAWIDADGDVMEFRENGIGMYYDSRSDYYSKTDFETFTWTYSKGWLTVVYSPEDIERARVTSYNKNQIIIRWYADEEDAKWWPDDYYKDEYGYHDGDWGLTRLD